MKKNAQSVEAWLEAMIAVARYYRLDFSQENVRATVNWERDSKREELLTDMARQLGMGLRLVEFSADSLNPWRLPLIAVFDNQQIGVITVATIMTISAFSSAVTKGWKLHLTSRILKIKSSNWRCCALSAPSLTRGWMTIFARIRRTGSGVFR